MSVCGSFLAASSGPRIVMKKPGAADLPPLPLLPWTMDLGTYMRYWSQRTSACIFLTYDFCPASNSFQCRYIVHGMHLLGLCALNLLILFEFGSCFWVIHLGNRLERYALGLGRRHCVNVLRKKQIIHCICLFLALREDIAAFETYKPLII